MRLRNWIKRLERNAREGLDSFELLDGSRYYFSPLLTYKTLWMHAYDVHTARAPFRYKEPPEFYRKVSQAKDVEGALELIPGPEDREKAFIRAEELFDIDILIHERRLVPIVYTPEDQSVS